MSLPRCTVPTFQTIRNIGLAYTTITEEKIEIQVKRDLVDELYKTAYKRYREKYPNKDFASIPNFLDSLWFSIEGELNRNGYFICSPSPISPYIYNEIGFKN